jgi:ADP-ribose 1''-phosphate phosphatase
MVNGKKLSDNHASQPNVHKVPLPTDNSTTMAQSAKPTSSTSEATITMTKKYKIRRCTESDEEDIEHLINEHTESKTSVTKSVKPKTNNIKQQVIQIRDESDDEDDEAENESEDDEDDEEDSDDDHTNSKKPVKAASSTVKEQASRNKATKKRALDSDDEEVVDLTNKFKKSKSKATIKKQIDQESDSEDDIIDLTKKPTTSKHKTTQKQLIKPGNSTPTKKEQTFMTSKAPEPESSEEEEEDSSEDEESPNVTLTERIGDLFSAPSNTLLVHACNCVGSWNAGIALAFQKKYPAHYAIYQAHCKFRTPNSLLSTCLLIPPQPGSGPNHWIGCLFTSRKYGRGKDSKDDILDSTDSALQDMLEQLEDLKKKPKGVWMCKINSGSFKVPWSQTKKLIEALTFKGGLQIDVVDKK